MQFRFERSAFPCLLSLVASGLEDRFNSDVFGLLRGERCNLVSKSGSSSVFFGSEMTGRRNGHKSIAD